MGRRPEEVEVSLWADMEEEQSMVSFRDIDAHDLLRMYNLSLVQTLLFKARSMEIAMPEGCVGLVSTAKRLGLMYRVEKRGEDFLLSIDGPLSALRLCERYGNLMARLVPEMVRLPRWEMRASIAWRGERPSLFELSSSRDGHLIAYRELDDGGTDEAVADRAKMLSKLRGSLEGWAVEEVASPVTVEGSTFLPDLKASKGGQTLYLELLGFWTEDFLRKRPTASRHGGYFAFAERSMACSGASKGAGVILYDKRTLVKEVVSAVQRYAESHAPATQVEKQADGPMPITGDLLDLRTLARNHGTDEETLFRSLEPKGYIRLREILVSRKMAERIASEVMGMANYLDASVHIRNSGIPYPDDLLRELGFTVVWHGLDPQRAELRFIG
jgi:predicted nuclease of restriction endonuclease-like RecB superfamily